MMSNVKNRLAAAGFLFLVTACSISDQVEDFSIRTYPDEVLFESCEQVENGDPKAKYVLDQNDDFKKKTLEANGFLAYCLQHEIDHLDGKLYIDYLSPNQKRLVLRKYFKQTKVKNEK